MNTDAKLYYAVLGVDPAASDAAIRLAFRRRAKELHPDSVSGSANAFIRLKRAYDTLSDPVRRAEYDRDCRDIEASLPQAAPQAPPPPATLARRRPSPPRPRPQPRAGGIGFFRYAVAFLIMGGISFGAIEAMISFTEAPPAVPVRMSVPRSASSRADAEPTAGPAAEASSAAPATAAAPGSSRSGFWDADPTPAPAAPTRRTAPAAKQW